MGIHFERFGPPGVDAEKFANQVINKNHPNDSIAEKCTKLAYSVSLFAGATDAEKEVFYNDCSQYLTEV